MNGLDVRTSQKNWLLWLGASHSCGSSTVDVDRCICYIQHCKHSVSQFFPLLVISQISLLVFIPISWGFLLPIKVSLSNSLWGGGGGGGGVLSYLSYMGMCHYEGYGFQAV